MTRKTKRTKKAARRRATPAAAKPLKLTRAQITARDHKDLGTYELSCRVSGLNAELRTNDEEVTRLQTELTRRRAAGRTLQQDVDALEGLIESRR